VTELAEMVGERPACRLLGASRATLQRHRAKSIVIAGFSTRCIASALD